MIPEEGLPHLGGRFPMSGHVFCVHKGAHACLPRLWPHRPWIDAHKAAFGRQRDSPSGPTEGRRLQDSISIASFTKIEDSVRLVASANRYSHDPMHVGATCPPVSVSI